MLNWLLEHCQSTGFNEDFSYSVIDCDLIIKPLMEIIGGVWREQNEAFCAWSQKWPLASVTSPLGPQCQMHRYPTAMFVRMWGQQIFSFFFFESFLLTSTCVELPIDWVVSTCPSSNPRHVFLFHALIIWSLSFSVLSFFCSFLVLYHHLSLFMFLF